MELQHRLVGPGFAVEVAGLDLARPPDDTVYDALRALWMEHKVLVVRDQRLDESAMMAFTRPLGELFVHVRSQFHSRQHKEVMVLTNAVACDATRGAVGDNSELAWHSDQSYTPRPVWGTWLHAIELPHTGGETCFADLTRAREQLPPALAARVAGLRTRYSIHGATATLRQAVTEEQSRKTPEVMHPLLRRHPYLPGASLYLSPAHATGIEGMAEAPARALLHELTAWASRPEFVYEHQWRPGDVIMWDNTQTMHRRAPFPDGERRTLLRTGFYLPPEQGVPLAA